MVKNREMPIHDQCMFRITIWPRKYTNLHTGLSSLLGGDLSPCLGRSSIPPEYWLILEKVPFGGMPLYLKYHQKWRKNTFHSFSVYTLTCTILSTYSLQLQVAVLDIIALSGSMFLGKIRV
jgi:hypothetical protein